MAKALRHAALSLLILPGLPVAAPAIEMEGVVLVSTSGPRVVQKASAGRARLSDDGRQVVTEAITLDINFENGRSALAKGDAGYIVIGGERAVEHPKGSEPPPPTRAQVESLSRDFADNARVGDILLVSREMGEIASLGESGGLRSTRLLWSESFRHYALPERFEQNMVLPDGTRLRLGGDVAIIDKDFTHWKYLGGDASPASLDVEGKEPTP